MMVHPSPYEQPEMPIIAVNHLQVAYTGKEAHASAYPFLGVNAADALVVAQTAIGLLRQHLRPGDRHGIVTKGGDAANIIPAHTDGQLDGPGRDPGAAGGGQAKVTRCFEAGALATGATESSDDAPYWRCATTTTCRPCTSATPRPWGAASSTAAAGAPA